MYSVKPNVHLKSDLNDLPMACLLDTIVKHLSAIETSRLSLVSKSMNNRLEKSVMYASHLLKDIRTIISKNSKDQIHENEQLILDCYSMLGRAQKFNSIISNIKSMVSIVGNSSETIKLDPDDIKKIQDICIATLDHHTEELPFEGLEKITTAIQNTKQIINPEIGNLILSLVCEHRNIEKMIAVHKELIELKLANKETHQMIIFTLLELKQPDCAFKIISSEWDSSKYCIVTLNAILKMLLNGGCIGAFDKIRSDINEKRKTSDTYCIEYDRFFRMDDEKGMNGVMKKAKQTNNADDLKKRIREKEKIKRQYPDLYEVEDLSHVVTTIAKLLDNSKRGIEKLKKMSNDQLQRQLLNWAKMELSKRNPTDFEIATIIINYSKLSKLNISEGVTMGTI